MSSVCDLNPNTSPGATVTEALFTNNSVVNNNTIVVNAAARRLGSSLKTFDGNTVTFNSSISTMFEFYNITFTSDVTINNNIINCQQATTTNDTLFMLNGTTLNGYVFSLSNNKVTCSPSSTTKSFYYMAISDSTPQKIVLTDNSLSKYTGSYIQGGMSAIYNIVTN